MAAGTAAAAAAESPVSLALEGCLQIVCRRASHSTDNRIRTSTSDAHTCPTRGWEVQTPNLVLGLMITTQQNRQAIIHCTGEVVLCDSVDVAADHKHAKTFAHLLSTTVLDDVGVSGGLVTTGLLPLAAAADDC